MGFRVLADAPWRPSRLRGVLNADLAGELGAEGVALRLWRLRPGEASARHRHAREVELYVVLEGTGRMRVEDDSLTLAPLTAVLVEPATVRQLFNDTARDALWLVAGAPPERAATYPDGPQAVPPELA